MMFKASYKIADLSKYMKNLGFPQVFLLFLKDRPCWTNLKKSKMFKHFVESMASWTNPFQDTPKTSQYASKTLPRPSPDPQDDPRWAQDASKTPQEPSKMAQVGLKTPPRRPQDAPKPFQDPHKPPKTLSREPKTPPSCPKTLPRHSQDPPQLDFWRFWESFKEVFLFHGWRWYPRRGLNNKKL